MNYEYSEDDLSALSDEQLIMLTKENSDSINILISRYAKIVYIKAYQLTSSRTDIEDLIQEGMLAFLKAVDTYDSSMDTKFSTYANTCITNCILSIVLKNRRISQKESSTDYLEANTYTVTPEHIIIEREKSEELFNRVALILSDKEWQIFRLFLNGSSYDQMSRQLKISLKSVDNSMQRVRRKLKTVWGTDIL